MGPDEFRKSLEEKKKEALKKSDDLIAKHQARLAARKKTESPSEPCRVFCIACGQRVESFPHDCFEEKDGQQIKIH